MARLKSPLNLLLWTTIILALAWVIAGDRVVTHFAYAVERGRIQASSQELAQIENGFPELNAVARAFKLVAKVARPGVVNINVSGGEGPALSEREQELLRRHLKDLLDKNKGDADEDETPDEAQPDNPKKNGDKSGNKKTPDEKLREERDQLEQWIRHMRPPPGTGSGIIFDPDGYILTNNHVVSGRPEIKVKLYDDREFSAKLIGTDPKTDLAVVKIDAPDLHPLAFGNSDAVEVGDWVLAVGSPFGLTQTVTHGIVSATGRTRVLGIDIEYQNFIQTDAAINPGNSGGPLLSIRGEIVGVNTAIATHGDGVNAGIAFTIPANRALKVAQQLRAGGTVVRGWLGVSFSPIGTNDVEVFGLTAPGGVFVERVLADSPAAEAGLQVEDILVGVNGAEITGTEQLRGLIAELSPREIARVRVIRDGAPVELSVRLGEQPEDMQAAQRIAAADARHLTQLGAWGKTFRPWAVRTRYDEGTRGVEVRRVEGGRLAGRIAPGEVIVGCGGNVVKNVRELVAALQQAPASGAVELEVLEMSGDRRVITLEPGVVQEPAAK